MAKKKTNVIKYYEAIGRRKSAIARVRLYLASKNKEVDAMDSKIKQGEIYINNQPIQDHFPSDALKAQYDMPLVITGSLDRFAISVLTQGGGKHGQMEATILGIARALELADSDFRKKLKPQGLLTRDPRVRERRKVGTGGRARRQKQSPKR